MAKPVVQPLDQTTQSVLITNVYAGADLSLSVNEISVTNAVADHLSLGWRFAANAKFGDLNDGQHTVLQGRFSVANREEILFYYAGDGHWWGTSWVATPSTLDSRIPFSMPVYPRRTNRTASDGQWCRDGVIGAREPVPTKANGQWTETEARGALECVGRRVVRRDVIRLRRRASSPALHDSVSASSSRRSGGA